MIVNTTTINILNQVLQNVQQRIQSFLKVQQVQGDLILTNARCGAKAGVQADATPNINTDLVLFVTSRPSPPLSTDANVAAWAVACQYDQKGRSIAGMININPEKFYLNDQTTQIYSIMHETTHVLGFSGPAFSTYLDENGNTRQNTVQTVSKTFNGVTKNIMYLTTPSVIAATRTHFNCSSAIGAELEEFGDSSTIGSHWDTRVFLGEIMMGSTNYYNPSNGPALSIMTLAALQDSGWYQVDFTKSEKLDYGYLAGCSILQDRCENWTYDTGIHTSGYFCSESSRVDCTYTHIAQGFCSMTNYAQDLGYYEHFLNKKQGGLDTLMDFCPITVSYGNGDCRVAANAYDSSYTSATMAKFGFSNSRCFVSTLLTNASPYVTETRNVRCYRHYCKDNVLLIEVGNSNYTCPSSGGTISNIPGFRGYINCPDSRILCNSGIELLPVTTTLAPITTTVAPTSTPAVTTTVVPTTTQLLTTTVPPTTSTLVPSTTSSLPTSTPTSIVTTTTQAVTTTVEASTTISPSSTVVTTTQNPSIISTPTITLTTTRSPIASPTPTNVVVSFSSYYSVSNLLIFSIILVFFL